MNTNDRLSFLCGHWIVIVLDPSTIKNVFSMNFRIAPAVSYLYQIVVTVHSHANYCDQAMQLSDHRDVDISYYRNFILP